MHLVTVSLDTTGEPLHRRGHKAFVGKAPLRESMAAAFLWEMGFDGGLPAVVDPMCGSGTDRFWRRPRSPGLVPGRSRGFAFERFAGDAGTAGLKPGLRPVATDLRPDLAPGGAAGAGGRAVSGEDEGGPRFFGFDRDDGAIRGATGNAERAGVAGLCRFARAAVSDARAARGGRAGDRADQPALWRADRGSASCCSGFTARLAGVVARALRGLDGGDRDQRRGAGQGDRAAAGALRAGGSFGGSRWAALARADRVSPCEIGTGGPWRETWP